MFETEYGFHVLEVMERRGEQVRVRHILIKIDPVGESLARSKTHIDSVYQQVKAGKLPFSTAASLYSDQNETKYNGGMMLNAENVQSRTSYIPTDKLEPGIFLTIDTMKVGGYSKPEFFTDKAGKQGYRFLYLRSRTEPHVANLEQDFPKLKQAALEDKIGRTVSEWFDERRKKTFVKIEKEYQSCDGIEKWIKSTP